MFAATRSGGRRCGSHRLDTLRYGTNMIAGKGAVTITQLVASGPGKSPEIFGVIAGPIFWMCETSPLARAAHAGTSPSRRFVQRHHAGAAQARLCCRAWRAPSTCRSPALPRS